MIILKEEISNARFDFIRCVFISDHKDRVFKAMRDINSNAVLLDSKPFGTKYIPTYVCSVIQFCES